MLAEHLQLVHHARVLVAQAVAIAARHVQVVTGMSQLLLGHVGIGGGAFELLDVVGRYESMISISDRKTRRCE